MFPKATYLNRRNRLKHLIGDGLILLLGNRESPMNYPDNPYRFRQDSTFLYYFGLDQPNLAGVVDTASDEDCLYGDDASLEDVIWMGPQPNLEESAARVGVGKTRPFAELQGILEKARTGGRKIHFLPPYRGENSILFEKLLAVPIARQSQSASKGLVKAVVRQRSVKDELEIAELGRAAGIGGRMQAAALRMASAGVYEREIAAEIEAVALRAGGMLSFPPIVTVRGETLHNHYRGNRLQKGDLLLVDCGCETDTHYASDHTRTLPVGGRFSSRQREIHQAVLACMQRGRELIRPGVPFREVHLEVCKVLTTQLKALGLMKGDAAEAVRAGAHALFMPHGLGHMLGLDTHDMEDLGEEHVGYDDEVKRSDQFGLNRLRLGRRLETGFVLTIEPGIYFIPALIDKWRSEGLHRDFIDYEKLETYRDFGGLRLEDDVLVTEEASRLLGAPIPLSAEEIEEAMKR